MNTKLQFYRDNQRQWRWRLRARNGRIVATSGEGYSRRAKARGGFVAAAKLASEISLAALA